MSDTAAANTLGLDFDQLKISKEEETTTEDKAEEKQESKSGESKETPKKKPQYVNPERVKTGGIPVEKLSEEELSERMARMREQNEKIKQRRLDVQADEDAFKKTQEAERLKQAQTRKVQDDINKAREQNAKRKMDKIQSREWDSGKSKGESSENTSWRGRGRGRGRGKAPETS